jgi:MFS family permease
MLTGINKEETLPDKEKMENKNTKTTSPFSRAGGYTILLRNKNFLYLWLGQIFSQLGDRVTFVVFVAVIASLFGSSTSLQSWLYVSFTIPAILLTALAGVFIDRWNKKYTMIITNIIRAVIIAMLPLFNDSIFQIYVLAFIVSSVTQFFVPAEASTIPSIVNKRQLLTANSLFTTTMMASVIFGFALGDPLINIFTLKSVHIAISALFLISAFWLFQIKYKSTNQDIQSYKTIKEFFGELKEGFIFIKKTPLVFNSMFKLAGLFSIIVMMSILAIGLSQEMLYPHNQALGAQKFVYIVAFSGIGMVIGAFMVAKFFKNIDKMTLIFTGFTMIGLNLVLLTLVGEIPQKLHIYISGNEFFGIYLEPVRLTYRMIYAYVVAGLIGMGGAFIAIPVQTLIHANVPENIRGKVFGVQFTLLSTSSTFPVLVAALGADTIGVVRTILFMGIPVFCFGMLNLFNLNKANK